MTTTPALPAPEPRTDPADAGYWAAAATGVATVSRCPHCDVLIWHPRSRCPRCTRSGLELRPVSGDGVVYSFTVNRRPAGAFKGLDAVVIAYVELAEGPRILTNLVDVAPDDVRIGLPVRAVHTPTAEGSGILRFAPAEVPDAE